MFSHKNRAKFFDFIIPVVPIINSSNSLDKMQERLKNFSFSENIDLQFLREVSLYIDDLRLIHNIFNEFSIYFDRLSSGSLDVTKLLAMMIYKNVYPNDFEKLHGKEGYLYDLCEKQPELIEKSIKQLNEDIGILKVQLELSENERINNIEELINTYVGYIVKHTNLAVIGFVSGNQNVPFSQITSFENFEFLLSQSVVQLAVNNTPQNHSSYRVSTGKSFSQIEEEINPGETFLERKSHIENKSEEQKRNIQLEIKGLETEMANLVNIPLQIGRAHV